MLRVSSASSTSATVEASSLLLEKGGTYYFPDAMMTPFYLRRIASESLVHPRAWKGYSANFVQTEF
jgi:hypothetical protein